MPQDGHRFRAHRDHAAVAAERRQHRAQRMDVDGRGLAGPVREVEQGPGKPRQASQRAVQPRVDQPRASGVCSARADPGGVSDDRVGCLVADYDVAGQDREQPIATRYARQLGQVKQRLGQLVSQPRHRLSRLDGSAGFRAVRTEFGEQARHRRDGQWDKRPAERERMQHHPPPRRVDRAQGPDHARCPTGPWPQLHEALQGHDRVLVVGVQFRFHQRAAAAAAVPDKHRPSTGSGVNPRTGRISCAQGGHVKQRDGWPTQRGAASEPTELPVRQGGPGARNLDDQIRRQPSQGRLDRSGWQAYLLTSRIHHALDHSAPALLQPGGHRLSRCARLAGHEDEWPGVAVGHGAVGEPVPGTGVERPAGSTGGLPHHGYSVPTVRVSDSSWPIAPAKSLRSSTPIRGP